MLVIYEGLTCWAVPALFMAWGMAALEEGKPSLTGALAGLVLYMLAAKLALRLTGSALNQYQGIDKMGSLDVSAIPTKLAQAYGTVFNYFIADTPIYLTKLMRLAQGK